MAIVNAILIKKADVPAYDEELARRHRAIAEFSKKYGGSAPKENCSSRGSVRIMFGHGGRSRGNRMHTQLVFG